MFSIEVPVRFRDTDSNGHVNNAVYNSLSEEAVFALFREAGWDKKAIEATEIGPVVLKAEYTYLKELKYPDTVLVETEVEVLSRTRAVFRQDIFSKNEGILVCKVVNHGMWLDFKRKRPVPLPEEVLRKMEGKEETEAILD
ncbi:acyl-CoA thioesterase [Leptospira wolffii]|uniref:Acyl-CoA thioester hydrolase n=1 Tax=Leptospira wolffii TaxID=409998 RepID=A0A2M9ZDY8_9LEPT|nr:thioesterase family protein [Leptospira wolffii]PJZ66633.1 acyl-CoA thioester hydrolase [Leptospira wolffii]TGK61606.1 acyl-CoA thioesterase [Leptospira wolffii]TGK70150.1 acyl-CoA thioesterase [Leptospira wolffii]TGK77073.1 acyl-CoA thioesterase [Leptospira wolffii]TGL31075.1 acyl-CoA thioesterase [Leptospira wolffii]